MSKTIKLGSYGQGFDLAGDRRAYTYKHQPGNQAAWRIGDAASRVEAGGDLIDRGLSLLKALEAGGFGVFELDEAAASIPAPEGGPALMAPTPLTPRQREVLEFLYGAGPLDGHWFEPDRKPKYWWRAALREAFAVAAAQPATVTVAAPAEAHDEPAAWMHEDDPSRVISAIQKAQAEKDGGASASSVKAYSIRLTKPQPKGTEQDDAALTQALEERDAASDYIDALLDEVLGKDRHEWTSNYGHADAMDEVRERMAALQAPAPAHALTDEQAEKLLKDFAIAVMFGSLEDRAAKAAPIKAALAAQSAQAPAVGDQLAAFRAAQEEAGIPDEDLMPEEPVQAVAYLIANAREWQ